MTDEPRGGRDGGDDLDVPQWVAAGGRGQRPPTSGEEQPAARERPRPAPGGHADERRGTGERGGAGPGRGGDVVPGGEPDDAADAADEDLDDGYGPFLDFDGADGRDYVRLPRRPGALRRVVFGAGLVVLLAVVTATAAGWWVLRQIDPAGPPGEAVTVTIEEGQSAQEIADLLDDAGVVSHARLFREYLRFRGAGDRAFQAGPYAFNRSSSMGEALAVLEHGPGQPAAYQLTMPEGLRVEEMAGVLSNVPWFTPEAVDEAVLGNVVRSRFQPAEVATLEGLVFPDTYQVEEGMTPVDAVTRAVGQLDAVATELSLEQRAAELGYTPYQVLTIASLIEREASVPEDRAKVARVIYNRIGAEMRLDIDATVVYALGGKTGPLTQSDLETDSPYNTRLYPGLPPTPIAAPGRASIEAALSPEPGDWLYYVLADSDGRHYFTEDYDDFLAAVEEAHEKGLLS
ncbi:MAG: endolytic transglycosylase MltG [Acidimicrobiia bacterium]|nr:endolytic transglycosylase MltG [Acidimicrobiia bacterium]